MNAISQPLPLRSGAAHAGVTPPGGQAPTDLAAVITAAEALVAAGDVAHATAGYANWLAEHPDSRLCHVAWFNQGVLLNQAGQPGLALGSFAEAIRAAPTFVPAFINAGVACERLGRPDLAIVQWRQAVARADRMDADSIRHSLVALKHLGRVCKLAGDLASAEAALRQSIEIDPGQLDVVQHWVALRQLQCRWPVLHPCGRLDATALPRALSPLSMAILADDPILQLAQAARHFARDVAAPPGIGTAGQWAPPDPPARLGRRLRIGYVSPDLREHAVGYLTTELFELHDRARVEVFAYYSGPTGPDATQARIRRAVDRWTDISGCTERDAARRIVADGIDVLVDLGGYTADAPTSLFALRPAPVIVNWLGFPGTMGTPHHHYIVADAMIIPPCAEIYYTERILRLPCYQPSDRKRHAVAPPARADVGLPDEAFVFCCFNGTQKIGPAVFAAWMRILAAVPEAVLWLLSCDAATDARLREAAAAHGVAPARLVFAGRAPNAAHLARYPLADLFLDTWPYGAHTTASDALWMGLPVLTVAGRGFAARVCASLVCAAGLPDLVCDGFAEYVARAVALACDGRELADIRTRLRAGRDGCTLFNMEQLTKRLETLFERAWDEYADGRLPAPDLTNLAVYAEVADELGPADESVSAGAYRPRFTTALAYRDSVSRLSPDGRFWPPSCAAMA